MMISRGKRTELEAVLSKMRAHFIQEQRWAKGCNGDSEEEYAISEAQARAYGNVVRYIDKLLVP